MICSLLRDRRKYDEAFRRMQMDPVYPYLNSMTGLNDPGDDANTSEEVTQRDAPEYKNMSRSAVCKDLVQKAEKALPSLVEICKAMAGSLGMEEVGVGKYHGVILVCFLTKTNRRELANRSNTLKTNQNRSREGCIICNS